MNLFEVLYDYKPRKPIDLIPMTYYPRVFESASAFTLHIYDLHRDQ